MKEWMAKRGGQDDVCVCVREGEIHFLLPSLKSLPSSVLCFFSCIILLLLLLLQQTKTDTFLSLIQTDLSENDLTEESKTKEDEKFCCLQKSRFCRLSLSLSLFCKAV